jgi:hypothetical protein
MVLLAAKDDTDNATVTLVDAKTADVKLLTP